MLGSSYALPAHGRVGQGQGPKKSPSKKFACPEARAWRKEGVWGRNSAAPERLKFSVRILPEIGSDFVQGAEHSQIFVFLERVFRLAASRLGSENRQISE